MIKKISINIPKHYKKLSEYKGPILCLTPEEKQTIEKMQKEIGRLDFKLYELDNRINSNNFSSGSVIAMSEQIQYIMCEIAKLKKRIQEIKQNRFRIQKTEFENPKR